MLQNPQVKQIRNGPPPGHRRLSTADKDARPTPRCGRPSARLKEGLYEDAERRAALLVFSGALHYDSRWRLRSLKQYVADLKPNQTEIYYLVGESADRVKSNPKLEAARARGIEVLLLTDPIDAFWTMLPQEFEGKPLKSLSQGDVDFGLVPLLDQAAEQKTASDEDAAVVKAVKEALAEQVSDVRASQRLTESAACLVASAQGRDRELERLLARQNRESGTKPILELNMGHDLVKALATALGEKREADVSDIASLLLDQAHILDGDVPADPAAFAKRLNAFVVRGLRG
jgi:molecular chaperone HtpG